MKITAEILGKALHTMSMYREISSKDINLFCCIFGEHPKQQFVQALVHLKVVINDKVKGCIVGIVNSCMFC